MKIKIKSKTIKNKFIYGDLLENKKTTTLAVFLSGFSGSKELPLFKSASLEFFKNGFSTLKFNFCNDDADKHPKTNALKIENMSFSVYTAELKNIIDSFGNKYSKIVLVGHSFRAVVSILFLSKYKKYAKKTELVLWDPTLLPWKKEWMREDFVYNQNKKLYQGKIGKETINKRFYRECIITKDTAETLRLLNQKVCVIAAKGSADSDSKKNAVSCAYNANDRALPNS